MANKKRKKKDKIPSPKKEKYKQFRKGKDARIAQVMNIDPGNVDPQLLKENEDSIKQYYKRQWR